MRSQYAYPDGPIVVALKLYGQGAKALTDTEATELDPELDPDAAFRQEVSIMSGLQGHPSIAALIGFVEGTVNGIVMRMYDGSLSSLIDAVKSMPVLPFVEIACEIASGLH